MSTAEKTIVPFIVHGTGEGVAQQIVSPGSPHAFKTNTYPAFGGTDEDPSPLLYALGSLSSCNQITASLVAKDLRVVLGEWSFVVQGDLDPSVLVGGAQGNANFDRVAIEVKVETDATAEQFATLVSETERRCPVTQLFKRSGTQFEARWEQTALPVAA